MMWDAEMEALRGELMQLSHSELLALAKQEGVHTAGRAAADIVDALLRMECAEDAAVTAPRHAPGQLAPPTHRDQPHHSSGTNKQQQLAQHASHHHDPVVRAHSKPPPQQQQQHHPLHQAAPGSAAGGAARHVAGLSMRQQHGQQQREPAQQQRRSRHSEYEQELQHESSFTFAAAGAAASGVRIPAGRAGSSRTSAHLPAARATFGNSNSCGLPYQDQVSYTDSPPSAAAYYAPPAGGGNASDGRLSARQRSATPPRSSSREAYKQQQNLVLETKMQQLEQSLQQLPQRSPRLTPPQHVPFVSAQHSYTSATGGTSSGGGNSGGGSAAKTNRRLWSSPSASPAATSGTAGADAAYSQPLLSPSSRSRPVSRPGSSHGFGCSPEPSSSQLSGGGSSGSSRPRATPQPAGAGAASAAGPAAVGARPMSSGGGAYGGGRGSSNILAEHAAQRPGAAASAADTRPSPCSPAPSQQQHQQLQQHTRALSMSPAPAKGTPRVGVMPCQKAMLKKAAQEAAKGAAAATAAATPGGAAKHSSVEQRPSSSRGAASGSISSRDRGAASSSGAVVRSASNARAGTPERPARGRHEAAAGGDRGPGQFSPLPSPKLPSERAAASLSGTSVPVPVSAGRVSASATGALAATPARRSEHRRPRTAASAASLQAAEAEEIWGTGGAGRRGESVTGGVRPGSSGRASVHGLVRTTNHTPRAGCLTPPPGAAQAGRAAPARGEVSLSGGGGGYSSSSSGGGSAWTPVHHREQQQQLSVAGAGLAGRARTMLAGSPVLAKHAREAPENSTAAAGKQPQLLHTPMRVKSSAAGGRTGALQQQQVGYATPVAAGKTRSMAAAAAAAVSAAVTPARQQVRAFGDAAAVATPTAAAATRSKAPLAGTAAAAAAAAASDGPAVLIGGMMTPAKAAIMGSARRVASTQARTVMAAAAAAAQDMAAVGGSCAAQVPVTPLHKGARRMVPSDGGGGDEVDKHLQALVERCLRIRNPDAHKLALHGPEPAKRWLQQHLVGPWKRTGATGSSSGGGPCMAAGYCSRSLLLHGPSGSGKTEVVHALASEMGANLLYLPGGESLLKTYQQEGHRLLRALFAVARRVAPCVVCFDDADMNFPSSVSRMSDPGGAAATARMVVELEVQLQQLADMQAGLAAAAAAAQQAPHSVQKPVIGGSSSRGTPMRSGKSSSGGGSGGGSALKKPVWGFFGCKAKSKSKEQSPEEGAQHQQQQAGGYARMAGPVVVVFVTHRPDALDGALLQQLPVQLGLDVPSAEAREDLLMGWLMEREAAVNVQDVEVLARHTEGFSCSDLVRLCQQAARGAAQERSQRAICMADLENALNSMLSATQQQHQVQQQYPSNNGTPSMRRQHAR